MTVLVDDPATKGLGSDDHQGSQPDAAERETAHTRRPTSLGLKDHRISNKAQIEHAINETNVEVPEYTSRQL